MSITTFLKKNKDIGTNDAAQQYRDLTYPLFYCTKEERKVLKAAAAKIELDTHLYFLCIRLQDIGGQEKLIHKIIAAIGLCRALTTFLGINPVNIRHKKLLRLYWIKELIAYSVWCETIGVGFATQSDYRAIKRERANARQVRNGTL